VVDVSEREVPAALDEIQLVAVEAVAIDEREVKRGLQSAQPADDKERPLPCPAVVDRLC
jgi:hypothetical protein